MSHAYEQLVALGGEVGMYTPDGKAGKPVLAVIDGLWSERREERYRAAPLLRAGAGLRG